MANILPLLDFLKIAEMRGQAAGALSPFAPGHKPPPINFSMLSPDTLTAENARRQVAAPPPRFQRTPTANINQPINPPPPPWFAYNGGQALAPGVNERIPVTPFRPDHLGPPTDVTGFNDDTGQFQPNPPLQGIEVDGQQQSRAPQFGIQPKTDPGFGSYQPSAADFGEKQSQPQQGGMSDAGMWGLLAAGLGILANNYGNYGQASPALGKGGLIGLETFLGERQRAAQNQFEAKRIAEAENRSRVLGDYYRAQTDVARRNADTNRLRAEKPEKAVYKTLPSGGIGVIRDGKLESVIDKPEDMVEVAMSLAETDAERAYARTNAPAFIKFKGEEKARMERAKAGKPEFGFTYYDKKRTEAAGAAVAKRLDEKQQAAMQSGDYADQIATIANVLEDYEGGLTDEIAGRVGKMFPNSPWGAAGTAKAFVDSVKTKLAPSLRIPGSGATTDFEMRMYLDAIPGMMTSRDGRKMMVSWAQKIAEREAAAADLYAELADTTEDGAVPMRVYRERIKALGPLFTNEDVATMKRYSAGESPASTPQTPASLYRK